MKAVLMSIKPRWCELIASGKKTVEVRKTKPKMEVPFKVYIYETNWSNNTYWKHHHKGRLGKVIGEFVCDAIFPLSCYYSDTSARYVHSEQPFTCLTDKEMIDYLGNGVEGYGWHISNLVIYDKPRELGEFWSADKCPYATKDGCTYRFHCFRAEQTKRCGDTLTRPPQSYCYVEEVRRDD